MNKYNSHNHLKSSIRYHIILSVKYHKKILLPIIDDLKESFRRAEKMSKYWKIEIIETDLNNGKDHHVHLLIKALPQISPNEIVHKLKQISTYDMWQKHRIYLKKFFWKKEHHLWTRGYFISSVGNVSEKKLKKYIEKQG